MHSSTLKTLLGAAACAVLLSGCTTDGVSFAGGTGHGFTGGGGTDTGGGGGDSGGGGTGGGGDDSGGGVAPQASLLGDGVVTVTATGTTVSTPSLLGQSGIAGLDQATSGITSAANTLLSKGNAALPLGSVAGVAKPVTSLLPVSAEVSNTQIGAAGTQPIGVGILSETPATGSLVGLNVANAGKTVSVTLPQNQALTALSGVVGSAAPATGPVTSAVSGLVSPVTNALGLGGATDVLSGTGAVTNLLNGTSSLSNTNVGNTTLVSGSNPLTGASVASTTQAQGSLLTAGANSANQPTTLKLGETSLLNNLGQ
jgi:hypothetical protein